MGTAMTAPDIVGRLRLRVLAGDFGHTTMTEAADEIVQLRMANTAHQIEAERLRERLAAAEAVCEYHNENRILRCLCECPQHRAWRALAGR